MYNCKILYIGIIRLQMKISSIKKKYLPIHFSVQSVIWIGSTAGWNQAKGIQIHFKKNKVRGQDWIEFFILKISLDLLQNSVLKINL